MNARQFFVLLAKMPSMKISADHELDVSGLQCPMPLLKAKLALNALATDQVLKVIATDPASERDFNAFVTQSRHQILAFEKGADTYSYWIRKG
jgi:tRNA 2-thiouridine synthesizing protein A